MDSIREPPMIAVTDFQHSCDEKNKLSFRIAPVSVASSSASPTFCPVADVPTTPKEPFQLPESLEEGGMKRHIHRWKSPLLMVVFFLIGLAMSLAHCIFYPSLRDQLVGNPDAQEEKIR